MCDPGRVELRESGPGARPMHPEWARGLRDQCAEAGTAFFFKQMSKKAQIPDDLQIREIPRMPTISEVSK
jgi:protein gp37